MIGKEKQGEEKGLKCNGNNDGKWGDRMEKKIEKERTSDNLRGEENGTEKQIAQKRWKRGGGDITDFRSFG